MATRRATALRQVELVDAALHVIATRGIAALSTRSLAAEVGLSSGAIFRHFPSLEALLDAVVGRVEEVVDAALPPPELAPLPRLAEFIEARASVVGGQLGIVRLMQSEQFLLALPRGGAERLTACVARTRQFIEGCLRDGQAAGQIRADLPLGALIPIVMGTVQMLALAPAAARMRGVDPRVVVTGLVTLLAAPPPARPSRQRRPA